VTPLYRLAPVLFLAMVLAGCAGTVGSNNSAANGTGNGSTNPPQGTLGVTPSTLTFGSVAVGSSSSKTATLSSTTGPVQVSSADWNGQGYSVSGISFPVTVTPGTTVSFTVTFAPTVAGSTSGSIAFASNATDANLSETLSGTGTSSSTGGSQHSVALSWTPPNSNSISGYNIYRGTNSGGPYTKINSSLETATDYTDSTVQSATTYYYVATSVDSSTEEESAFSNQTVASVPQ
jgi:hypothetical protein